MSYLYAYYVDTSGITGRIFNTSDLLAAIEWVARYPSSRIREIML
jgi:hypothetical protein